MQHDAAKIFWKETSHSGEGLQQINGEYSDQVNNWINKAETAIHHNDIQDMH